MANERIRLRLKSKGVCVWELADALGIHENTLYKRLRHQLDEKKTSEICILIDEIAKEKNA